MTMKLLSADDFRSAAKDGAHPDGTVFRFATAEPQSVEGSVRTKRFVFSDSTVDHAGDTIDAKGWDLSIFNKNPVALWSHDSAAPPIGRALNVGIEKGKLAGDIEFAPPEVSEFADSIYRLVDGGYLNAVSVGFRPKDWSFSKDKDRPYGIDFKSQVLLEISVCSVPCNPSALQEARSAGIDTSLLIGWAEKVLDSGDTVFLPRKELDVLRGQAGATERKYYLQTAGSVPADAAQAARDIVKAWESDPAAVLALPEGITLRTICAGIEPKAGMSSTEDADEDFAKNMIAHHKMALPMADKEIEFGSDAKMVELAKSIKTGQTAEITQMEDWLKSDGGSEKTVKTGRRVSAKTRAKLMQAIAHHDAAKASNDAATKMVMEAMDGEDPDDDPDNDEPDGSVVLEAAPIVVTLTPQEQRIKEARQLRGALPAND